MKKLSTGEDSTLGNYRKMAVALLGEDNPAVEFLNKKIKEQGENEEVMANESQMVFLLMTMGLNNKTSNNL